jgi:hypothetical protein
VFVWLLLHSQQKVATICSNIIVGYSLASHHRLLAYIRSNPPKSRHLLGPESSTNNATKNTPHPRRHCTFNSPVHKRSHPFEAGATVIQSQETLTSQDTLVCSCIGVRAVSCYGWARPGKEGHMELAMNLLGSDSKACQNISLSWPFQNNMHKISLLTYHYVTSLLKEKLARYFSFLKSSR